ncbi:MAG: UV DNA damage repair endonuclease UvsE [Gemmatimonadales bacterium]|nr:UV DNA damage repair endonuclease UvsE [Gemmatimonadales bacterium]
MSHCEGAQRPKQSSGLRSQAAGLLRHCVPRNDCRLRWGLCCQFLDSPIQFRTATHRYVATLEPEVRRAYLADIAGHNAGALAAAVERCHQLGIGAFRMSSQILPLATHPDSGYTLDHLDPSGGISGAYEWAGALARAYDVRLSFHPDQFVVLNSEREAVVKSAVQELELQGEVAEIVGADVIVVHAGGAGGGVPAAVERLERGLGLLTPRARERLALENDDRCFTPLSLGRLCQRTGVPLVYDAHHHRCLPDGLSVAEASELAFGTWGEREPYAHISSPRDGWESPNPRAHADYIDPADFPGFWLDRTITVDVEAKAKERAVLALKATVSHFERSEKSLI